MEPNQPPLRNLPPKERQAYLFIMQLRRTPAFRELVAMLDRGKSVWATTDWFMAQPAQNRGSLANCSFETARKYINTLSLQMKTMADKVPRRKLHEFRQQAFHARLETQTNAAILNQPEPKGEMEQAISAELERSDVITMLKYCFAVQKERITQLRQLEKTANMIFPFGDKSMNVLQKIASALWHVQAGEALLRSKSAWPINMGEVSRVIDLLPEVKEVAELDPVDQNLIREAFNKTIDLLEQQAGIGQYAPRVADKHRDK